MFVTNHVLAGIAIGARCGKRPGLAFLLGLASHLPMDRCRHWGCEGGMEAPVFLRAAVADGCTALGVLGVAAVAARRVGGRSRLLPVVAGALGAAALDVDKPARLVFGCNPVPGRLQRLHERLQEGMEAPAYLWREAIWAAGLGASVTGGHLGRQPG